MKKILVIRSSAMGDVAMTAPVLRAVSEKYGEQLEMVMLTNRFYEPFFDDIANFSVFPIELNGKHHGVRGTYRLFKELRSEHKFDAVLDLNHKLYSRLLRCFFNAVGVKTYHIDKGRREKKELTRRENRVMAPLKTSIERYADVFAQAGWPIITPTKLPEKQIREIPAFAGRKNGPWIGMAPFAKHKGKILPIETIQKTIEALVEHEPSVRVFIFGGGRAEEMVADSLVAWYGCCTSVIGRVKLRGELDLISNLDVMVSMDSSAMHMSSLVGTPVVSVWGATHPYAGFLGLGQLLENVVQTDDLTCRPCSVYGNKPCWRGDYACLTKINASDIASRVISLMPCR